MYRVGLILDDPAKERENEQFRSLIAYHPISRVAIFNAYIPVFGVILSSLILGERFEPMYLVAGLMVTAGTALSRK